MKIYMFRHGQTDWNAAKRIQGHSDVPLNDEGRRQAEAVAGELTDISFAKVYASPLVRAQETARILLAGSASKNLKIHTDDRLKEFAFGTEEGAEMRQVLKGDQPHPLRNFVTAPDLYVPPEGGESIDQVRDRVMDFFENELVPLEKDLTENDKIMLVAHGGLIRAAACGASGRSYRKFWGDKVMGNVALNLFEIKDGKISLIEEAIDLV